MSADFWFTFPDFRYFFLTGEMSLMIAFTRCLQRYTSSKKRVMILMLHTGS